MPRREDLKSVLVIGSGPIVIGQGCEFDYSGTQACRVLKQEGIRVSLVNSNPATIMTDPEFADATYVEPITHDILEKVIARERPDAVLPTLGGQTALNAAVALHAQRHAQEVQRRAHRRRHRRDRGVRGPRAVQGDRHRARRRGPAESDLPHHRRVPRRRGRTRPARGHQALLHPRRRRLRHRLRRGRPEEDRRRGPGRQPHHRGPPRGVDHRLEGVRARADARRPRQRRDRLLDRERRPDGRAHRGLRHGRPRDDAHRPRVPADAGHRDQHHPRGRRGHRRLQHPVRRQPEDRPHGRHRDEPARQPKLSARLQGHRLPDRQDRHQARNRLHAGRDPERHHRPDARELRARARLRGRQDPEVRVREVPRRRHHADHPHEVGRRGDGDRPLVRRGAAEGAAQPGEPRRPVPVHGNRAGCGGTARPLPHPARRPPEHHAAGAARRCERRRRGGCYRHRPMVRRPAGSNSGNIRNDSGRLRTRHPALPGREGRRVLRRRRSPNCAPSPRSRYGSSGTRSGCGRSTTPSTRAPPSSRRAPRTCTRRTTRATRCPAATAPR